jgi:hypothetical protein
LVPIISFEENHTTADNNEKQVGTVPIKLFTASIVKKASVFVTQRRHCPSLLFAVMTKIIPLNGSYKGALLVSAKRCSQMSEEGRCVG